MQQYRSKSYLLKLFMAARSVAVQSCIFKVAATLSCRKETTSYIKNSIDIICSLVILKEPKGKQTSLCRPVITLCMDSYFYYQSMQQNEFPFGGNSASFLLSQSQMYMQMSNRTYLQNSEVSINYIHNVWPNPESDIMTSHTFH